MLIEKADQTEAAEEIGLAGIVHMAGPGVPARKMVRVIERLGAA